MPEISFTSRQQIDFPEICAVCGEPTQMFFPMTGITVVDRRTTPTIGIKETQAKVCKKVPLCQSHHFKNASRRRMIDFTFFALSLFSICFQVMRYNFENNASSFDFYVTGTIFFQAVLTIVYLFSSRSLKNNIGIIKMKRSHGRFWLIAPSGDFISRCKVTGQ